MGCINSKKELSDINPNIYRVVNVDEEGVPLWSGQLGITRTEITLYRKGREPTHWPLACLRRYGYDVDLFTFESGRRCTTGEGIYAFRCRRAESLFQILQNYIQLPITNEDSLLQDLFPVPIASNGPLVMPRNRASAQILQPNLIIGGSYIINNRPTSHNLSPSGTINSSSNRSRSFDTLDGTGSEGNYLQPTPNRPTPISRFNAGIRLGSVSSGGPLSPDPHSPGSPNSITNILEVTPLNPLPASTPGISNLYQDTPIRDNIQNSLNNNSNNTNLNNNNNNNNHIGNGVGDANIISKKLSLDIPPQELAPSLSFQQTASINGNVDSKLSQIVGIIGTQPQSPGSLCLNDSSDNSHMYMNITPGEMQISTKPFSSSSSSGGGSCETQQIAQTPTTTGTMFSQQSRLNSTFSMDPNRCYENLDTSRDIRPIIQRNRYSKPDIFSKVDLPSIDKSEPSTPTIRRFNYIVLDLDQTSSSSSNSAVPITTMSTSCSTIGVTTSCSTSTTISGSLPSNAGSNTANSSAAIPIGLLPPDSPKKGVLDYATIDFNKTVALFNSTTPSSELDCEGSRKTRHNSTAILTKNSNSLSE